MQRATGHHTRSHIEIKIQKMTYFNLIFASNSCACAVCTDQYIIRYTKCIKINIILSSYNQCDISVRPESCNQSNRIELKWKVNESFGMKKLDRQMHILFVAGKYLPINSSPSTRFIYSRDPLVWGRITVYFRCALAVWNCNGENLVMMLLCRPSLRHSFAICCFFFWWRLGTHSSLFRFVSFSAKCPLQMFVSVVYYTFPFGQLQ